MNRIATTTVIRGNGDCQVFINGIASAEMKRQQARLRAERECHRITEASRNKLLRRSLDDINRKMRKSRNPIRRAWDRVVNAWAMGWAMLICYSLGLGLIEEIK